MENFQTATKNISLCPYREPLPNSKKVYVNGTLHPDLRVPMREIALTADAKGNRPEAVTVYDTSGPITDPAQKIKVEEGLPKLRHDWILKRGDVETSATGALQAKAGKNVSQLHYARAGIITPEMEYIALRENGRRATLNALDEQKRNRQRRGSKLPTEITAEFDIARLGLRTCFQTRIFPLARYSGRGQV